MKEKAQKINSLIKESKEYQLYKNLKNKIDEDQHLKSLSDRMNSLKKVICKDRNDDLLKEYYDLEKEYKSNPLVADLESVQMDLNNLFKDIVDILSLK